MFLNNTTLNTSSGELEDMVLANSDGNQAFVTSLVALSIIVFMGIIGNSLVMAVVGRIPSMRTTTNYLLVNVAVADLVTLLLTALHVGLAKLAMAQRGLAQSVMFCKFIQANTISNVPILATGWTLTVIAIERYNALIQPMKNARRLTKHNVWYAIAVMWVVSIVMCLPLLIYLDVDDVTRQCTPGANMHKLNISLTVMVILMTLVPFIVIAICYFQIISGLYFKGTICTNTTNPELYHEELVAKRRLVKLLLMVTAFFFFTFVPYGVAMILRFSLDAKKNATELLALQELVSVLSFLIPLHSALNPVLYAFQSRNYREGFWIVTKKIFRRDSLERNNNCQRPVGTMV
ncbi:predicted protein [Nematostella vectensis]|uniref:G-protein coupled receptors family 1 profile domain-containing protein n=1 Tax=Nematostella vectensis TaxID=45351 RepID=A7RU26_NEMVE|nr:galanin receptor 2b [Nematostella vectensis]EDO45009.1 predicted protein [Nematostella vectensis]|eukprot:XP_001637072.1 predicted protein [Nematostella vectensis]